MATMTTGRQGMTRLQQAALVVGGVFLAVGVLGFVPGITQNAGQLQVVGHESEAKLLGIFQVNVLHNVVHLLFGAVGVLASRASQAASRGFLLYGGAIYLVLWVYGLVIDLDSALNFVALNTADNWLHLALGVGMVALALLVPRLGDEAR
jgi:hypothetical protein